MPSSEPQGLCDIHGPYVARVALGEQAVCPKCAERLQRAAVLPNELSDAQDDADHRKLGALCPHHGREQFEFDGRFGCFHCHLEASAAEVRAIEGVFDPDVHVVAKPASPAEQAILKAIVKIAEEFHDSLNALGPNGARRRKWLSRALDSLNRALELVRNG